MTKTKLSLSIFILLIACAGFVFAAGKSEGTSGSQSREKILFAVASPMTGDSAAIGQQIRDGAQIAVDEINLSGGVNGKSLEFMVLDDEANPNKAAIVAEKIAANDRILFVDGHNNSSCTLAGLPAYQKAGVPVVSPTNFAPKLTQLGYKNFFRICPTDDVVVKNQVDLAIKEFGGKKPAIIWENTDYGKSGRDLAAKRLSEVYKIDNVLDESYVPGVDRDYSSQVTKLKGAGVDVVLFMGEYTAAALYLKQAASLNYSAKLIGNSGCSNPKLMEIAGAAAEGAVTLAAFNPTDKRPLQAEFIAKYQKRFNIVPGEWASHSYDVVYLAKKAYEMGGASRAAFIEQLRAIKDFRGVTGTIEFDDKGDVPGKSMLTLIVKDGKFQTYTPTSF